MTELMVLPKGKPSLLRMQLKDG